MAALFSCLEMRSATILFSVDIQETVSHELASFNFRRIGAHSHSIERVRARPLSAISWTALLSTKVTMCVGVPLASSKHF